VSQPLTGQVSRLIESRKHTLSPVQRQLLFTLADRIPRGRLDWETTWKQLADSMNVDCQWLRTRAYALRKLNIISLSQTRYGVRITLVGPFVSSDQGCRVSQHPGQFKGVGFPNTQGVGKTPVDRPLTIPSKTAPKTPGEGGGGCSTTGACAATSSPPDSLASGGTSNGIHKPLSTAERISLEDELKVVKAALKTLLDSYDDHMDVPIKDKLRKLELKARIARINGQLGRIA
jgi:hypothetical protein